MVQNKFTSDDPYVLTLQMLLATNNSAEFNVAMIDTDHQRATSATFVTQAVVRNIANPAPDATIAAQSSVGAALAGIDQPPVSPADSGAGNGGFGGCFVYNTPVLMADGKEKSIGEIDIEHEWVKAFDTNGHLIDAKVTGKHIHIVQESLKVTFADHRVTHTTPIHKYWVGGNVFEPIFNLNSVRHWNGGWGAVDVLHKEMFDAQVLVYNLTVDIYHNYIANGDAVSNIKPAPGDEFQFQ